MRFILPLSITLLLLSVTLGLFATPLQSAPTGSIGTSFEGRDIVFYRFGEGERSIVVYGGIHGGYEWNTIWLNHELITYYLENGDSLPGNISLYIIPCLNPDGLARVDGRGDCAGTDFANFDYSFEESKKGRFNARGVDLNRNWDARWQPKSMWQNQEVSAGGAPFSEPETRSLRDFVQRIEARLVISYHSAANGIYYSGKHEQWEPVRRLARAYEESSCYPIPRSGTGLVGYRITGASGGYFYSQSIPEITVELAGRSSPEFERNLSGLQAVIDFIASE